MNNPATSNSPAPEPLVSQPAPQSGSSAPADPSAPSRRCRGAIARLPRKVRDQVNNMVDDGRPYADIVAFLAKKGHTVSENSISSWKNSGYQDWLREQRILEESRQRFNLARRVASDDDGVDTFQATQQFAVALICDALADIGADSLRQAVRHNPLNILRLLNSLARLTAGGLNFERHLCDQEERQLDREHRDKSRTLTTPEFLASILGFNPLRPQGEPKTPAQTATALASSPAGETGQADSI